MTEELREQISTEVANTSRTRLVHVLRWLGIRTSSWYYSPVPVEQHRKPGPAPDVVPEAIHGHIAAVARDNPWYGYHKIAVISRWTMPEVTDRQTYKVMFAEGLLQKRRSRKIELYQASKLYEMLPQRPNELWQMDVTYVHIPGYGWWYVVTVIDYYSRFLLAARLTSSYCAQEVTEALKEAREEAERIHGPLETLPFVVTDNGSSFIAKRFQQFVKDTYRHVRIRYRTPTQLGLLERFHLTFKEEEVYWRLWENPEHGRKCIAEFRERYNYRRPHWALVPEQGGDPKTPAAVYESGTAIRIPKWQGWAKGAKEKIDKLLAEAA